MCLANALSRLAWLLGLCALTTGMMAESQTLGNTAGYTQYTAFQQNVVTVSSQAELETAVKSLPTGGTIQLDGSGGPYNLYYVGIDGSNAPVHVTSLDSGNPAVLEEMYIRDSSYLTVTDVTVKAGAHATERPDHLPDITVQNTDHVEIVGITMEGNAQGMLGVEPDAIRGDDATLIRDNSNFVFSGNTVSNYFHAVHLLGMTDATISDNDIFALQGDGIRGGGWKQVDVTNNYIHDFIGTSNEINHPDMIQLWNVFPVGVANENINITGNILDNGDGIATQGILLQAEAFNKAGDPLQGVYNSNLNVSDNIVYTGHWHGIAISHADGLTVANNTVVWNESAELHMDSTSGGASNPPWVLIRNSLNTQVNGNIADSITVNGGELHSTNYALEYDDSTSDAYAYDHFVGLAGAEPAELTDLMLRPDSPLNGVYGASKTSWAANPDGNTATITHSDVTGNRMGAEFSAEYSAINGAIADPSGATYTWTFEDGTVLEGMTVVRDFDAPGDTKVSLVITTPDGKTTVADRTFEIGTDEVFATDFSHGAADDTSWNAAVEVHDPNGTAFVAGKEGEGFRLDGSTHLNVSRSAQQTHLLETFDAKVMFKAESFEAGGNLFHIPTSMMLRVESDKSLKFDLWTDQGHFVLRSDPAALSMNAWHEIGVSFDGPANTLEVSVDGNVVASGQASGIADGQGYPLQIGNQWGPSALGILDDFSMTSPVSAAFVETQIAHTDSTEASETTVEEPVAAADTTEGADAGQASGAENSDGTGDVSETGPEAEAPTTEEVPSEEEEPSGTEAESNGEQAQDASSTVEPESTAEPVAETVAEVDTNPATVDDTTSDAGGVEPAEGQAEGNVEPNIGDTTADEETASTNEDAAPEATATDEVEVVAQVSTNEDQASSSGTVAEVGVISTASGTSDVESATSQTSTEEGWDVEADASVGNSAPETDAGSEVLIEELLLTTPDPTPVSYEPLTYEEVANDWVSAGWFKELIARLFGIQLKGKQILDPDDLSQEEQQALSTLLDKSTREQKLLSQDDGTTLSDLLPDTTATSDNDNSVPTDEDELLEAV